MFFCNTEFFTPLCYLRSIWFSFSTFLSDSILLLTTREASGLSYLSYTVNPFSAQTGLVWMRGIGKEDTGRISHPKDAIEADLP